ncbi:MAG: hypothetical protein KA248_05240 [Kiritimatiellae bacterium]|nr:hypothetical protein [Kiritimatiellia bacterium]
MKYRHSPRARVLWGLLAALCAAGPARGQWISETFYLTNGWNAVYLRGTPWPDTLDAQFAGLPIRAVHRNYLQYDTTQFAESAADLPTRGTEWLIWYPSNSPHRVLTTLWKLNGNSPYLIECTTNCTWTPTGVPVIPARLWLPNTWNFVGLPVNPAGGVTFAEFFEHAHNIDVSPTPAGGKVFRTKTDGTQQDITSQTAILAINPKEAYWILTEGLSAFIGKIFAHATLGSLRYPPGVSINSFSLWNTCGSNQQVSVQLVASEASPAGAPQRVGDVPLLHFEYNYQDGRYEWTPLVQGVPLTKELSSNEEWVVTLAVDRSALSEPPSTNATWQSVLEVTDEGGTLIRVPVVAEYGAESPYDALWPYGLWVGNVTLDKVTQLADGAESDPVAAAGELEMRLIVHIGTNGQARLLQQVVLELARSVSGGVTSQFYRLRASDRGLAATGEASRVSSVAFPYGLNVAFDGDPQDELTTSYVLDFNSAVNPFKHLYNPNHDNVSAAGLALAEGEESYTISNNVSLVFDPVQPYSPSSSLWNPEEELTGSYVQTMHGLRNETVEVEGRFTLQRVSRTGVME